MKMLLKTNNRRWELYCRIESYLQLQRERERERDREGIHNDNLRSCDVEIIYCNANQVTVYAM